MKEFPKPNIVTVYEHYGLRIIGADRGGWRKAECPLPDHEDANPSASVNENECRWRCHACNESGDAVDLIEKVENARHSDARRIAEGFLGEGDGPVRAERQSSSLLPGRSRNQRAGGAWKPSWKSL